MAPRRLPRGTRKDPVPVGYRIESEYKTRLDNVARNAGVSTSVLIEHMVEHLELTDQGIPVWWTPLPRDEELPINSE